MPNQTEDGSPTYRIGAVARLTGIPPDTLRIWERRYAAVAPQRSARGGRLYSPSDVVRLRLMKQLVDAGDAIGSVARLELAQLQARAADALKLPLPAAAPAAPASIRLVLVGESLGPMLQAGSGAGGLNPVAVYRDLAEFQAARVEQRADILLLEQATLHDDSGAQMSRWLAHAGAARALVLYRYASTEALLRLPSSRCLALRAPLDAAALEAHCVALSRTTASDRACVVADVTALAEPVPARRYDDRALAQLATLSSTVKCECPRHLAELIASLAAFERYSGECESRSPRDAALHAFLHVTASRARHMIEDALDHVIEVENIQL